MNRQLILWTVLLAVGGSWACASEDPGSSPATLPGSRGITQGGPQDFALFRDIVERGEVPSPDTLDDVGFFAEHALDQPLADCGLDVCMHPMLAVAPRFDGGNWTMAFVSMNTPVDPAARERSPVHLVLAVERTDRVVSPLGWEEIGTAIRQMLGLLRDGDRVTLVGFAETASVLGLGLAPTSFELQSALADLAATPRGTSGSLYDALAVSGEALEAPLDGFEGATRIVLLTSGIADAGITDRDRIVALGESLARGGTSFSVVGIGDAYDARVPVALGEIGAGSVYYAQDALDLGRVLAAEAETTLMPLATDYALQLAASPGYRIGRVYGARRASARGPTVSLSSPALFIGMRTGSSDVRDGRRGGGGGLFVELIADSSAGVPGGEPAFRVSATWRSVERDAVESSEHMVENALAPGDNPPMDWPEFSDPEYGKAFMMLNMYLALRAMVELYDAGDCARAKGVIDMMDPAVTEWQRRFSDPDIDADWLLLRTLRSNIDRACEAAPIIPIYNPYVGCFMS